MPKCLSDRGVSLRDLPENFRIVPKFASDCDGLWHADFLALRRTRFYG